MVHACGNYIQLYQEDADISNTKIKKMLSSLGICLADGNFYNNTLRSKLKETKELRVPLKTIKESNAKCCLVFI